MYQVSVERGVGGKPGTVTIVVDGPPQTAARAFASEGALIAQLQRDLGRGFSGDVVISVARAETAPHNDPTGTPVAQPAAASQTVASGPRRRTAPPRAVAPRHATPGGSAAPLPVPYPNVAETIPGKAAALDGALRSSGLVSPNAPRIVRRSPMPSTVGDEPGTGRGGAPHPMARTVPSQPKVTIIAP